MADTMKRIALWALGQMLPREEVFDRHVRHMARGVTWLVCGGVIITALFLSLLGVMYMALVDQGMTATLAAFLTGFVALLGAVICFLLADRALERASKLPVELRMETPRLPTLHANVDLQGGLSVLLNAFIDGARGKAGEPYQSQHKNDELLDRLRSLQDELEALLAEEMDEMADEDIVTVEREYDEDKDIIHFRPRHKRDEEAS